MLTNVFTYTNFLIYKLIFLNILNPKILSKKNCNQNKFQEVSRTFQEQSLTQEAPMNLYLL